MIKSKGLDNNLWDLDVKGNADEISEADLFEQNPQGRGAVG